LPCNLGGSLPCGSLGLPRQLLVPLGSLGGSLPDSRLGLARNPGEGGLLLPGGLLPILLKLAAGLLLVLAAVLLLRLPVIPARLLLIAAGLLFVPARLLLCLPRILLCLLLILAGEQSFILAFRLLIPACLQLIAEGLLFVAALLFLCLPRIAAGLLFIPARLLILPAGLLLCFARITASLPLIPAAGLLRRIPAELSPLIPMRGTADMLHPCFGAAHMSQLRPDAVASPARLRPMTDNCPGGPPDRRLAPGRAPRVGVVGSYCHRQECAERGAADERRPSSCWMRGFGARESVPRRWNWWSDRLSRNSRPMSDADSDHAFRLLFFTTAIRPTAFDAGGSHTICGRRCAMISEARD
jgi:hypothetical protein